MSKEDKPKFNRLEWQREHRRKNKNLDIKKYEKTKKGKLMRTYRNMLSRVRGVLKQKSHLYFSLPILTKEDFYNWSLENKEFNSLYENWVNADYNPGLSPSIDRVDVDKGYELNNIRWITHSENSSLGGRWSKNG